MRRRGSKRQENKRRKKRQPIIVEVRAAVLRPFRLQQRKKFLVWGEPGLFGTLGVTSSHFDPIRRGQKPYQHVEAAVDWWFLNIFLCSFLTNLRPNRFLLAVNYKNIQGRTVRRNFFREWGREISCVS